MASAYKLTSVSLLHLDLRLAPTELHHVNGLDQIVVAEGQVKTLEGFLLVPVSQAGVGNVRIDPAPHGIRAGSAGGRGSSVRESLG